MNDNLFTTVSIKTSYFHKQGYTIDALTQKGNDLFEFIVSQIDTNTIGHIKALMDLGKNDYIKFSYTNKLQGLSVQTNFDEIKIYKNIDFILNLLIIGGDKIHIEKLIKIYTENFL